jgi:tRNA pseudouridine55 synthase
MDGGVDLIIPINKPAGYATYDLIRIFQRRTGFKGKIGHGGTLDPFASGVVLLLLGMATKRFEDIKKWEKVYIAGIRIDATSSTGDIAGAIEDGSGASLPKLSRTAVERTLTSFIGRIEQKVPSYSAAKHEGTALYKLARQGIRVEKSKIVEIGKIELLSCRYPIMTIRVACSGGTYIRQLAQDIGEKLGSGGFLYALERESVGPYGLKDCRSLEDLGSAIL